MSELRKRNTKRPVVFLKDDILEEYHLAEGETANEGNLYKCYPLRIASESQLDALRKNGKPGFILKETNSKGNAIYKYAEIEWNTRFLSSRVGAHLCAASLTECEKLTPVLCSKVHDAEKKLELYPFITKGYESFNTSFDSFVVVQCTNYCAEDVKKVKK